MTEHADRFFTAIILGDIETVRAVLPEHPDALSWLTPAGYPALHMAILNRRDDIAVLLVEHGASLSQEALGETAAHLADRKGLLERLQEASVAGPKKRETQAEKFGENMRAGLENPMRLGGPLSLKRKKPRAGPGI